MRILGLDPDPLARLEYRNVSHGGGVHTRRLEVLAARVEGLPGGLDGVAAASDLQGVMPGGGQLPVALAGLLEELGESGELPPAGQLGVLLGGDLHADPELRCRGLPGEVGPAWEAFRDRFRWVLGVPGNHDRFAEEPAEGFLDGEVAVRDGLSIGGLGGVISSGRKPYHHSEQEQLARLRGLVAAGPDLLLLHEGPGLPRKRFPGSDAVRGALEGREGPVLCGHKHWQTPLGELPGGAQVLNVDARCVVLLPGGA